MLYSKTTHAKEKEASSLSDETVLLCSCEEPKLFGILLDRYQEAFMRKAQAIVKNEQEAKDVVQETFIKVYRNAHTFAPREGASFSSWGYKILINTALTRYRKLCRERGVHADVRPEVYLMFPDAVDEGMRREERDYVSSMLSKMPRRLRRALRLHILENRSQEEVAHIEGVSVGAIKARVHRAKKLFKRLAAI